MIFSPNKGIQAILHFISSLLVYKQEGPEVALTVARILYSM